ERVRTHSHPGFQPADSLEEFHKLVVQNNTAKGIIVDLRSNPGGRLTECTGAAGRSRRRWTWHSAAVTGMSCTATTTGAFS
ncbi:MAG: hypothetical protein HC933_17660, partial [Pleurocapsa sp. SU_196_0]|nr:hypothetical protein [Pleurocapsa sp. SU_196_0]